MAEDFFEVVSYILATAAFISGGWVIIGLLGDLGVWTDLKRKLRRKS